MMSTVPSEGARTVDSVVAIEKPHKTFAIHYDGGRAAYRYGGDRWSRSDRSPGLEVHSEWVNLADSIGYVTVSLSQDRARMVLPKPGVRSALTLYHVDNPEDGNQRFIQVAFPNQTHEETKAMAASVAGSYSDGVMTCSTQSYSVWANFSDQHAPATPPTSMGPTTRVETPPNTVVMFHRRAGNKSWEELR